MTWNEGDFIISSQGGYFKYQIDKGGLRPYAIGTVAVYGQKKLFVESIAFPKLSEAREWLRSGAISYKCMKVTWCADHKQALAEAQGLLTQDRCSRRG